MKPGKLLIAMAAFLLLAALVWSVAVPGFIQLPCETSDRIAYFGNATWTNPNEAPKTFAIREVATKNIISKADNIINVQLATTAEDLITGEKFWESVDEVAIYEQTREYVDGEGRFDFPQHLEKKDIANIKYYSYLPATTFKFEREDVIYGLPVYVYSFDVQNTDVTGNYPVWADSGKQILSHDFGLIWIEPASGHAVNELANWDIGFADGSGKIDVGSIWYREDTKVNRVMDAEKEKRSILLLEVLVPVFFAVIASAFIVVSFDMRPSKPVTKERKRQSGK